MKKRQGHEVENLSDPFVGFSGDWLVFWLFWLVCFVLRGTPCMVCGS